ncbi:unnamed protein product [Choristocarpus tenellus]
MVIPFLTPADVFSLGDAAAFSGSPGAVVKDGLLGEELATRAHQAARDLEKSGKLKPAGMGSGNMLWKNEQKRGDHIMWITDGVQGEGTLPEVLETLLQRMSAVGSSLRGMGVHGRSSGLRLTGTTSVQLAYYPGDGRGYVRHLDTPKSARESEEANRKASITMLYYLNPNWDASMGGQLRIHLGPMGNRGSKEDQFNTQPAPSKDGVWDIEPLLDRTVIFRSELVHHEVLPAFSPRLAVTMWFHGRQAPLVPPPIPPVGSTTLLHSPVPSPAVAMIASEDTRDKVRSLPIPRNEDENLNRHAREATIFVSVVSYRDSETNPTVTDLWDRAENPARVSVGVVWQLEEGEQEDERMFSAGTGEAEFESDRRRDLRIPGGVEAGVRGGGRDRQWGQRRVLRMPAGDAAGPCWARHIAQSLWRGEDYYLQIDSHMRFRPGCVC